MPADQGRDLAAVRTSDETVVVLAIDSAGRLVSMTGDPANHPDQQLSEPLELTAPDVTCRRSAGAAVASRGHGDVTAVVVADDQTVHWYAGSSFATIGDGWDSRGMDVSGLTFDPAAHPAVLALGEDAVMIAAVGTDGVLRSTVVDTRTGVFGGPFESWEQVDPNVSVAAAGPVALGTAGDNIVLLAVAADRSLRIAVRAWAGGTFSTVDPIDSIPVSELGGVTAVTTDTSGLVAFVQHADTGAVHVTSKMDGVHWTDPEPLP